MIPQSLGECLHVSKHLSRLFIQELFTLLRRKPPFQRALEQYLQGLDEKEKAKDFFAHFRDQDNSIDPSSVNRIIQDKVDERWLRSSTTGQVLQTLASIQMNYDGVVNSLSNSFRLQSLRRMLILIL